MPNSIEKSIVFIAALFCNAFHESHDLLHVQKYVVFIVEKQ